MSIVTVTGLTKYFGATCVLHDVSFRLARGQKVALIGDNGSGKSTLLRILAGVEQPTAGGVQIASGTSVGYLAQETRFAGSATLWEAMEAALAPVYAMRAELTALEQQLADSTALGWEQHLERYGDLLQRFELAGGYELPYRIASTLASLGFVEAQHGQPVAQLSGGQRTRAALAAVLLAGPELLLLDEPTNHLDLQALEWLERYLSAWRGTLVVISHDRYFLDHVTERTIELAGTRLEGDELAPYSRYVQLREARRERQRKEYAAQQAEIAKTEEFIRRYKAGSRAGEARGRLRRLERLKRGWEGITGAERLIDAPAERQHVRLQLASRSRGAEQVLTLDQLQVGYRREGQAPHVLLRSGLLELRRGQRVALLGPNGSGKTTLLRTIIGELRPLSGRVQLGQGVEPGYYDQAHEGLRLEASVLDEIRRIAPTLRDQEARRLLARFLFSGDDVFKRVGDLSGGERSRVRLAQLALLEGNLLLLDEPTNHLDIAAREALEQVLRDYPGSLMFVSHDRALIDALADTLWIIEVGRLTVFEGGYGEYLRAARAGDGQPDGLPAASRAREGATPMQRSSASRRAALLLAARRRRRR